MPLIVQSRIVLHCFVIEGNKVLGCPVCHLLIHLLLELLDCRQYGINLHILDRMLCYLTLQNHTLFLVLFLVIAITLVLSHSILLYKPPLFAKYIIFFFEVVSWNQITCSIFMYYLFVFTEDISINLNTRYSSLICSIDENIRI